MLNANERVSQLWTHLLVMALVILILKVYVFQTALRAALDLQAAYSSQLCLLVNKYSEVPSEVSKATNVMIENSLLGVLVLVQAFVEMIVDIVKALVVFYIDVFLGTYTCLFNAAVHGTLNFVAEAIEVVTELVEDAVNAVIDEFQLGLSGLSSVINGVISGVSAVVDFLLGDSSDDISDSLALVNLTISSLKEIDINASSVTSEITSLEKNLPDFSNLTESAVDMLAEPLESLVSQIYSESDFEDFSSLKSVAPSQVCDPDELKKAIRSASRSVGNTATIIMALLALAIVAVVAWHVYMERRHDQKNEELAVELTKPGTNILDTLAVFANPVLYRIRNVRCSDKVRWLAAYTTTPWALAPIYVGLLGMAMVALQMIVLSGLSKSLDKWDDSISVSAAADSFAAYLSDTNTALATKQTQLNQHVFGGVKNATVMVNSTITTLLTGLNDTIDTIFGSTPFAKPLSTIVYCTIGRKLESVEKGLTWINNNLNVTLPMLPESELKLVVSDTLVLIDTGMHKVYDAYKASLMVELFISVAFLLAWPLHLAIGYVIVTFRSRKPPSVIISEPKPLTTDYEYPFSNPFEQAPSIRLRQV